MRLWRGRTWLAGVGVWMICVVGTGPAVAQHRAGRPFAAQVVVPQARAFAMRGGGQVEIEGVTVGVVVGEQVATTTMDIQLKNPTSRRQEAELLVPVTEYTAFLAREGTDLGQRDRVLAEAARNFQQRAIATRTGVGAMNQSVNNDFQRGQKVLNRANAYYNEKMERVQVARVQQLDDRAFFQRDDRWVDSRLVGEEATAKPARVVEIGTEAFRELATKLARQNRAGTVSLRGDILMVVDGETILVRNGPGQ